MPGSSSKRHANSPASHDNRPSKRARTASKNALNKLKKGKKRDRREQTFDSENGSDSDGFVASERGPESDVEYGIPLKDLRAAGRTIARCCDMFCDMNKAIHLVMLSRQEEQVAKGEGYPEDEDGRRARKEALDRITPRMLARYKKVYSTLMREIPGIKTLTDDPSRASTLKIVLKEINKAMNDIRSSDSWGLRENLPAYILQNPKVDTMKPPINANTTKSKPGLNHVQLAGYLCPVESVTAFNKNAEEMRKELVNGKIDMSASELPAFLWEDNGAKYNDQDMYSGLFHGFYLERGPSTAHGGDPRGSRSCNAVLHSMEKVEATHISYAAVLARFLISSQLRWAEKDGCFNYRKFYYIIVNLIDECADVKWKEDLSKHYNMLLFQNEDGRGSDLTGAGDEAPASTSKCGSFLSRMRAQAAARATHTIK